MKNRQTSALFNPNAIWQKALWLFLIVWMTMFLVDDAFPYFSFKQAVFGRYWDYKWVLVGHILGGMVAIVLGPLQFWKSFRMKYMKLHRWLGRIYLFAILIGTVSSSYLAWTSALAVHWAWAVSLQVLGLAWVGSAYFAYLAIRRHNIARHQAWMIRSYVITFAFVSFRWLLDLPFVTALGEFVEYGPTVVWLSWVFPLFVVEIFIQWNKK